VNVHIHVVAAECDHIFYCARIAKLFTILSQNGCLSHYITLYFCKHFT